MLCDHYCVHGGVCSLELGHEGLHTSSEFCVWPSEESISKEEADLLFKVLSPFGNVLTEFMIESF